MPDLPHRHQMQGMPACCPDAAGARCVCPPAGSSGEAVRLGERVQRGLIAPLLPPQAR